MLDNELVGTYDQVAESTMVGLDGIAKTLVGHGDQADVVTSRP